MTALVSRSRASVHAAPSTHLRSWRVILATLTVAVLVLTGASPALAVADSVTPGTGVLTGTVRVAETITAQTSGWTPEGVALAYEWWQAPQAYAAPIGGVDQNPGATTIAGATAQSLALTPDLVGAYVWAVVTASAPDFVDSAIVVGGSTAVAAGILTTAPIPTLGGTVRVASPVVAQTGAWPESTDFTYSWRITDSAGKVTISKVTADTYAPTESTVGKMLSVIVTGTAPGYAPVSVESAKTKIAGAAFATAPLPQISGRVYVGSTVTVVVGTWSPTATFTYQWKRNGVAIAGATKSTYLMTSTDAGKKISVTVYGRRTAFATTIRTSAETIPVPRPFANVTGAKIVGTALAGTTLTASIAAWSPTPTYTYQWKRNGVAVAGATAKTYKLSSRDVGATMTVTVTGTRSGYLTRAVTSAATAKVTPPISILRDGMFDVGSQIAAGTYVATGGNGCWWERRTDDGDSMEGALGYNYYYGSSFGGQKVVTIKSTDAFFYTEGCGTWKRVATALKTAVKDGTWVVGRDIAPGKWAVYGPIESDGCYVELLGSFTGDPDVDIRDNGTLPGAGYFITITSNDKGFTTDGCGTWRKIP